jgi:hypothetical protein
MSMGAIDVAIIGAGPYGLSLGAHLRARGVDFRIFGEPMGAWRNNMPPGMMLKSRSWASDLSAPSDGTSVSSNPSVSTLRQFCVDSGILYNNALIPASLQTFLAYGEAFQRRFVPFVEQRVVAALDPIGSAFRLQFEDRGTLEARRVIVATGLTPFKYLPPLASHLPPAMVSHSSDHGPLDQLDGKEVIIVGSGSSATDLAALLHERGTPVRLVSRAPTLSFVMPPRPRRLVERLLAPSGGIGNGWLLAFCATAPWLVQALPHEVGTRLAHLKALGPLGSAFMRERVIGKIPVRLGCTISDIKVRNGRADLLLTTADGKEEILGADHVVFATGYKVDLERLHFLLPAVVAGLRHNVGAPALSRHYESSLPGLHFIGPVAAHSFGPVNRFIFGARYSARHLAGYLPSVLGRRISMPLAGRVPVPVQADPAVPL